LINNVLELSRLEKKQRHVNFCTGTFEEVIGEVTVVMDQKIKQDGFTLDVKTMVSHPFKYDREIMVQVLINLIENSLKFGKNAKQKVIVIGVRTDNRGAEISVMDTGPGIPRFALRKIFDDFYRVDGSLAQHTGGTGIGLSLVKKFITVMGGTVSAANNDGPGCTITITLPR
jgi:signal transduction histidine kinase